MPTIAPSPSHPPVEIREVYAPNLRTEIKTLRTLIDTHPYITLDTEFPGVLYPTLPSSPHSTYSSLKQNVDSLHLIQLGLSLSPPVPHSPSSKRVVWQFNFSDFDPSRDPHAPTSLTLLKTTGAINFDQNTLIGISTSTFAELLMSSGMILNPSVTWVSFHGAFDFAYLIKALTQLPLPDTLPEFLELVRTFFGEEVYDVKHMIRYCDGLFGGLDRVAERVGVEREGGVSHTAASDALLTWNVFKKIKEVWFKGSGLSKCAGQLFGLELIS